MTKKFICGTTIITREFLNTELVCPIHSIPIDDVSMQKIARLVEERLFNKYEFYIRNVWEQARIERVRKQLIEDICIEMGFEYEDDIF
jgi:hypothetical protein